MRGVNATKKWNSVRDKVVESKCDMFCLQETKKDSFDSLFIRNLCPLPLIPLSFSPPLGLQAV